jgi:uncharacterized protein YycO
MTNFQQVCYIGIQHAMIKHLRQWFKSVFTQFLEKENSRYVRFEISDPIALKTVLRPCDIILVEGRSRYSSIIKFLTQSTWSHCGIYIGDTLEPDSENEKQRNIIEAVIGKGVIASPLNTFYGYNTRILRPVGLPPEEKKQVINFCMQHLGDGYDTKNVWDLLFLSLALYKKPLHDYIFGSGYDEDYICSTLLAHAFASVGYPILPEIEKQIKYSSMGKKVNERIHIPRHHTHYSPRDFDLSPFFEVIKPTLEMGFNYKTVHWKG